MKLKRPKAYEVSAEQLPVMVENTEYPIANLKHKGAILNHIILFGYEGVWCEINVKELFDIGTNLDYFKDFVESQNITLSKLGMIQSKPEPLSVEEMNHEHYERLEKLFPAYDYYTISKLHKYLSKYRVTPFVEMRATLTRMDKDGQSIDDFIAASEFYSEGSYAPKPPVVNDYVTNDNGVIINPDTDYEYLSGGANVKLWTGQFKDGLWGNGMHVTWSDSEGVVIPVSVATKSPTKEKALLSAATRSLYAMKGQMTMGAKNLNEPFLEIQNLINTMTKQTPTPTPLEVRQVDGMQQYAIPDATETDRVAERTEELKELGMTHDPKSDTFIGFGFTITGNSLENDSDEEWQSQVTKIEEWASGSQEPINGNPTDEANFESVAPTPEPPKRALSIEVIGNLPADKIQEFKDLNKETEKLIKANPLIVVTDKATLEKAKKNRAAMLKACTSIDGKEGLAATTRKAFNTVKATFDSFLGSVATRRREHYNALDLAVINYEKAEELRIATEREAETKRVNDRTQRLFDAGMSFNGELYVLGNMYVTGSQITNSDNEAFDKLVADAAAIKKAQDAEALANQAAADRIAFLEAELAKARGDIAPLTGETPETIVAPLPPSATPELTAVKSEVVKEEINTVSPPAPKVLTSTEPLTAVSPQYPYGYEPGTELTPANCKALEDFDAAHKPQLDAYKAANNGQIPQNYIARREYFKMGLRAAGVDMETIFKAPADVQPTKPEQLKNLCKTLQNC